MTILFSPINNSTLITFSESVLTSFSIFSNPVLNPVTVVILAVVDKVVVVGGGGAAVVVVVVVTHSGLNFSPNNLKTFKIVSIILTSI